MTGMLKNFSRVKEVVRHVVDLKAAHRAPVKIIISGNPALGELVSRGARPGSVLVIDREELSKVPLESADLVALILGPEDSLSDALKAHLVKADNLLTFVDARGGFMDTPSLVDRFAVSLPREMMREVEVIGSDGDVESVFTKVIIDRFDEKKIALASAVPFFRSLISRELIARTALQNGGIALVGFVPGADMPILTANQVKLLLELMAVYGEEPTLAKLKEVLAVVGGGFILRTLARELLDLIPGPGWIIKGGVATAGTIAVGRAAQLYLEHEKGEVLEPLAAGRKAASESDEAGSIH